MTKGTIEDFCIKNNFSPRPATSKGLWLPFLLPVALIVGAVNHTTGLSHSYKLTLVVAASLTLQALYLVKRCYYNEALRVFNVCSSSVATALFCWFYFGLNKGWAFSSISAFFGAFSFLSFYRFLLIGLRASFSLGEAGLIAQSATLFFYNAGQNVFRSFNSNAVMTKMQTGTIIIQVGLLGILALAYFVHKLNIKGAVAFYTTACAMLTVTIIVPLHIILKQSPVLWIFSQVFNDVRLLKLFVYWSACTVFAVLAVNNQIKTGQKASTSTRKVFHILAVLAVLPGLYFGCSFLYMTTGIVLGVFFALEILRLLSIPPVGKQLQKGFEIFKDEKDAGLLALTPIYLLAGVSLPIWLHPSPCDVTNSVQFTVLPLLSGILSIGVGDTAASYFGSSFGRLKWANSSKTVEGTLACVLSQLGVCYFLHWISGFPAYISPQDLVKLVVSIFAVSIVEAKTSQIDNLVLPLIMYIILV
ncbi:hypothetical protein HUJ04_006162 [Dendroctonus ponderosae]